jgi:REP element-mobilizing transposase RayT
VATRKRYFYIGSDYHIYNRGNHREPVFRDNEDRRYFLSKLDEYCARDNIVLLAYCLMDNHFHLLVRQQGAVTVEHMMRSLKASFVIRTNKKYGLVGHLFQGRYQSKFIKNENHLAVASRYIHRNPAAFTDMRTYRWSSYRNYLGSRAGLANTGPVLSLFDSKDSYAMFVESALAPGAGR